MSDVIVRPTFVWPAELLGPILQSITALRRDATVKYNNPIWQANLDDAMIEAATAFAQANKWVLARGVLSRTAIARSPKEREAITAWRRTDADILEHTDWLQEAPRGDIVAAVTHFYGELPTESAPDFVTIEELPRSWYYPRLTTAYLLRHVRR